MPSRKRLTSHETSQSSRVSRRSSRQRRPRRPGQGQVNHQLFVALGVFTLIVWTIYRLMFRFPIWFDEIVGKAIFFGIPVWAYVNITGLKRIVDTFSLAKLKPGLLLGMAVGGVYGFAATITQLLATGNQVQAALLFSSDLFWWQFFLALMTGFWESLFFYSFVMVVIMAGQRTWSVLQRVLATALIFAVFHIPYLVIFFGWPALAGQLLLVFLFGLGQAFIFLRRENGYALVVSQAIWGMVLLTHAG